MRKHYYDYKELSVDVQQKISQGSVIPRPIAWVSTLNEDGGVNLAPFSYFAQLSPTLLSISFTKLDDGYKDTYQNLMRERQGVINIADTSLLEVLDKTSRPLEYGESEVDDESISLSDTGKIKGKLVNEAMINFEVEVVDEKSFMDIEGQKVDNNVVFLRIVAVHLSDKVYDRERGYVFADKLKPISRLGGPNYATILPIDFKREH